MADTSTFSGAMKTKNVRPDVQRKAVKRSAKRSMSRRRQQKTLIEKLVSPAR